MRLGPRQQHTITLALSSADCAARRQESGVLQQVLLLVFAAAPRTRICQALAGIEGVAAADCPLDWAAPGPGQASAGTAGSAPGSPAAPAPAPAAAAGAAAAAGGGPPPPYRLFVVARRVTVALVHRPADLAALLSVEARPFVAREWRGARWQLGATSWRVQAPRRPAARRAASPWLRAAGGMQAAACSKAWHSLCAPPLLAPSSGAEKMRVLFDSAPTSGQTLSSVDPRALALLVSGAVPPAPPAPTTLAAHAQKGAALAAAARAPRAVVDSPAAPLLRRYQRLLVLEEAAMEQAGAKG